MTPGLRALIDVGHLLGVIVGVGGLIHTSLVLAPASKTLASEDRSRFLACVRQRGACSPMWQSGCLW